MRRKYEETEALKDLILEKAKELFIARGYDNTKMQDIANAAKVSRGPLYYHYKDKAELFREIYRVNILMITSTVRDIYTRKNISFWERVEEDLRFSRDVSIPYLIFVAQTLDGHREEFSDLRDEYTETSEENFRFKLAAIKAAQAEGELDAAIAPEKLVDAIYATANMFSARITLDALGVSKHGNPNDNWVFKYLVRSIKREFDY